MRVIFGEHFFFLAESLLTLRKKRPRNYKAKTGLRCRYFKHLFFSLYRYYIQIIHYFSILFWFRFKEISYIYIYIYKKTIK